jgi:hypothetical protein
MKEENWNDDNATQLKQELSAIADYKDLKLCTIMIDDIRILLRSEQWAKNYNYYCLMDDIVNLFGAEKLYISYEDNHIAREDIMVLRIGE